MLDASVRKMLEANGGLLTKLLAESPSHGDVVAEVGRRAECLLVVAIDREQHVGTDAKFGEPPAAPGTRTQPQNGRQTDLRHERSRAASGGLVCSPLTYRGLPVARGAPPSVLGVPRPVPRCTEN